MFNDEISLFQDQADKLNNVILKKTGIAWDSDKKFKFRNPPDYGKDSKIWEKFTKPIGKPHINNEDCNYEFESFP